MLKIKYQPFEPNKGFGELQAKIYTAASGLPARAEEIEQRNISRGPEMTRYALTEKGDPLGYITAYDSTSEIGRSTIGYPWTMPDAPAEVQAKLFKDMITFLKSRENTLHIQTAVVVTSKIATQQLQFFKDHGFVEKERAYRYNRDFDIVDVCTWKKSKEISTFTSRKATPDDLKLLIELAQADTYLKGVFPTHEAMVYYFKNRVLEDNHAVLVFENGNAVAASAALRMEPNQQFLSGDEERILMRFTAIRPEYHHAWKCLLMAIAREAQAVGWAKIPLRVFFNFSTEAPHVKTLSELQPELEMLEVILNLPLNKKT
ncbi:MAG: hypothetical protein ACFFD8_01670 [Candidatus Thorarchaeota archaeon]